MLTEKQFFELIKALQSSNFSTTEILGLSFAIIIVALIVNFIVSFITEKAKFLLPTLTMKYSESS